MTRVPARYLYEHLKDDLHLKVLAGEKGMDGVICIPRIQKPGLALAGHLDQLHVERVQVLGATELSFLKTLDKDVADNRLDSLCSRGLPCIIITKGLDPPPSLTGLCEQHEVLLLQSMEKTSILIRRVVAYLEDILAPETSVHGCLVEVHGVGILLIGKSGIGKSECGLGLVERGHRLVGDDVVIIRKRVQDAVFGSAVDLIEHHMEIRGLGILNIRDLFGVASICKSKQVQLVVELVEWAGDLKVERLGFDEQTYPILGVEIPYLRIPVRSGRHLTMIIDVAARDHLVRRMGYSAAKEFEEKLSEKLSGRFEK